MSAATHGAASRLSFGICVFALLVLSSGAASAKLKVLHSFSCCSFQTPAGLIMDAAGNLYGTTYIEGAHSKGSVFKLTYEVSTGHWTYKTLYDFCALNNCADGESPASGVILDNQGNLYGTTSVGGTYGHGTVFKLTPNGRLKVLYNFCPDGGDCLDGEYPISALTYAGAVTGAPYDGKSWLYGLTTSGGSSGFGGALYSVTSSGTERVLYSFCSAGGCIDGYQPGPGGLILDSAGNLFGVTQSGGQGTNGVVFEVTKDGAAWKETVLHDFCLQAGCPDGAGSNGQMVLDSEGSLWGTVKHGGPYHEGLLFRLVNGNGAWSFNIQRWFTGNDGYLAFAGVSSNGSHRIYGTMFGGGKGGEGTVFRASLSGFHVLHAFCLKGGCPDGEEPIAPVFVDGADNVFGTTTLGGEYGAGTIFELTE
jgi:uncharacterized repeat protein (TIGR03803 family)